MDSRKMISLLTLVWIFMHIILVESKTKLSDIVPVCNINNVDINDCIKDSGHKILPILGKGIKDWGLIGLDPIVVPSIVIGQDNGPISLKWENSNVTMKGFSKVNITGVNVNRKGNLYNFAINVTTKDFSISGGYKARGKLLLFPIRNEGHQEIRAGSSNIYMNFTAKVEKRSKEEHLKIEKFDFDFLFSSKLKISLKSHNKRPTQLDLLLGTFINQNTEAIVDELKPACVDAFGQLVQRYIQRFFDKVPVKDLFKS